MMNSVIGALLGIGMAAGVVAIVVGSQRAPASSPGSPHFRVPDLLASRRERIRLLIATGAGIGLWLFTGWAVTVVLAPLAILGLPYLVGGEKEARNAIERLEALEEWVRQLASRLSAGIIVEQALVASAYTAPIAVREEVGRLSDRLRSGWSSDEALRRFADELASPVGDLVVAELLLATTRRGSGVSQSLSQLADLVAEEVTMHRQIEADRARPRLTARLVTIIAISAAGFLALSGHYMQPYTSTTGQVVLAGIGMVFIAALIWMRRMTATKPGPRFLRSASSTGGDQT